MVWARGALLQLPPAYMHCGYLTLQLYLILTSFVPTDHHMYPIVLIVSVYLIRRRALAELNARERALLVLAFTSKYVSPLGRTNAPLLIALLFKIIQFYLFSVYRLLQ